MGRKKQTEEVPAGTISVTDLAKAAVEMGHQKAGPAFEWAQTQRPDVKEGTFKATFSKVRSEAGGSVVKKVRAASAPLVVTKTAPSLDDLDAVVEMVDQETSLEELLGRIREVDGMAKKVGGLDILMRCVESLQKYRGAK